MSQLFTAVAIAAVGMLFAAPRADARPPQATEDRIAELRASCEDWAHVWTASSGRFYDYTCTSAPDPNNRNYQFQDRYNSDGVHTYICPRFGVDTAWICQ